MENLRKIFILSFTSLAFCIALAHAATPQPPVKTYLKISKICDDKELLKTARELLSGTKFDGDLDEEAVAVLAAYSILNEIPDQELKSFLDNAPKFTTLLNKKIADSDNGSYLSGIQKFMIILACCCIIGACGLYCYREYEKWQRDEALGKQMNAALGELNALIQRLGAIVNAPAEILRQITGLGRR